MINPRWRTLHRLGQARVLGISAAALVVAPLLSRLVVTLRNWLHGLGDVRAQHLADELHIPLVLMLLLCSALFALIGKVVYEMACPPYIKCGSDYPYFRHSYSDALTRLADDFATLWSASDAADRSLIKKIIFGALHLEFYSDAALPSDVPEITRDSTVQFNGPLGVPGPRPMVTGPLISLLRRTDPPNIGEEIFVVLRRMRDDCRYPLRIVCVVCYYASIGLAIGVTLYQMRWVYLAM